MVKHILLRQLLPLAVLFGLALPAFSQDAPPPLSTLGEPPLPSSPGPSAPSSPGPVLDLSATATEASPIHKVESTNDRLDMTVNTSRILLLGKKIAQAQVGNTDMLTLTPLSPNQVQISAKKTGVTQVNLWGEDQTLYTVDVLVSGDARELALVLRATFPTSALTVRPVSNSILISGFVDKPEQIDRIVRIAEEYYPKVINNMTVGGVQQVLLHVKIMEVSRTKLRSCGFDFSKVTGGSVITSGPAGLLTNAIDSTPVAPSTPLNPAAPWGPSVVQGSGGTMSFAVTGGSSTFLGVLDALRQDDMAKIMAEPTLTTMSGAPAYFNAGGAFYIVPQGLAAAPPIKVDYGTKIKFVPIVLGNGRIRLDIAPEVSQIDPSLTTNGYPGLLQRNAQTQVELAAGETLAIAGLVQTRTEGQNKGLPWISEVPYVGQLFRYEREKRNEVELLILVTPELAEAMDASEVPPCGPGTQTTSPSDWELFMKGHLEVPKCCPTPDGANGDCQQNGSMSEPPDGMILGPKDPARPPQTSSTSKKSVTGGNRQINVANSYNRNNPAKTSGESSNSREGVPNNPPGFIGPVGYDAVK